MKSNLYTAPKAPLGQAITIAVSVDNNYTPHLAALIESIKASFPKDRFFELFVLDGGVSKSNKFLLETQFFTNFESGSITFINCEGLYKGVPNHSYFTETIFYRISIGRLFPNHKKIIYLDTDVIVLSDISVLFDTDLGDNAIGAAHDLGVKSFVHRGPSKKVPHRIKGLGGIPVSSYLRDYLELGDLADDYFQTGVMLFNIDAFSKLDIENIAKEDLLKNKYWFPDQDALNKCLKNNSYRFDTSWNCLSMALDLCANLPQEWAEKAKADFSAPNIVHYTGSAEKPWNTEDAPLAHFYWFFLRRTFWYEQVLKNVRKKQSFLKKILSK